MSRVFSDTIDTSRISRIAATLEKHTKLRLSDHDIYVNVAGGIRITEVGLDLALAGALYSARTGLPLPAKTFFAGELSLAGEVRPIRRLASRIKAGRALSFTRFIGPSQEQRPRLDELGKAEQEIYTRVADIKAAIQQMVEG